jgi:tetratricopeptide (TPR) repeat protein
VTRASEALVRATGTLGKESSDRELAWNESANAEKLKHERDELQSLIRRDENLHDEAAKQQQAARHHQLAEVCEKLGDPLAAVHEYQRAAELDPSEPHLFDWASELLLHRAPEPATEVFAQGNRLYPQSVRMLTGLGVAWYARRSYERASQVLVAASDLAPSDPGPYLFMGKMESVETVPTKDSVVRLERFQRLQPDNPMANYYYALGLWKIKQTEGALDDRSFARIESLLQKAAQLDPKLGAAFLQLGLLYAAHEDDEHALAAYQKAVATTPDLEEAHYRLAHAYRRMGKEAEAQKEARLHAELAKKTKEESERQRREIQQFVISMRD